MRRFLVLVATAAMLPLATAASSAAPEGTRSAHQHPPGPSDDGYGPGGPISEAWAWTQLTSRGTRIRYVTTDPGNTCPVVRYTVGGIRNSFPLRLISGPSTAQFPTTVCQVGVPLGASNAVLDQTSVHAATVHPANRQLPLPRWSATSRPDRIAVIGDTGCQVTASAATTQSCATGWPFGQIARSAATIPRPDLVIHVGDYLYRDEPGNADDAARNPGCTANSDRFNWFCVVADFFRPAEQLLATAPVALTRGNHEDCNAAHIYGAGGAWFRYLADTLRDDGRCTDYSAPAVIDAGTLTLASVDSSFADPSNDGSIDPGRVQAYTGQFNTVNTAAQQAGGDVFLFTHKPLWMVKAAGGGGATELTPELQRAVADTALHRLADNIRLVLSGHVHLYQMLDFNTARQPQLTVGSAGGPLDDGPNDAAVVGQMIGMPPQAVTQSITQEQNPPSRLGVFGYGLLRDVTGVWTLTFHLPNGTVRGQTCALSTSLAQKSFACH